MTIMQMLLAASDRDPNWSSVSLLINGDGQANGSTTITDKSSVNNTITRVGNPTITTSTFKYGTGAVTINDGNTNRLNTAWANSGPLDIRSGNFTIESWIYITNRGVVNGDGFYAQTILSQGQSSNRFDAMVAYTSASGDTAFIELYAFAAVTLRARSVNISLPFNTWHHVAWVRSGNTILLFLNGTSLSLAIASNLSAALGGTAGIPVNVGWLGFSISYLHSFYGIMDDLRVTKGVARYTATFTPPTKEFPTQ